MRSSEGKRGRFVILLYCQLQRRLPKAQLFHWLHVQAVLYGFHPVNRWRYRHIKGKPSALSSHKITTDQAGTHLAGHEQVPRRCGTLATCQRLSARALSNSI